MDRHKDLGTLVKFSKAEIAPSDIGRTIDAEQLQNYDPRYFQVVLFPRGKRNELREYLKDHAYPYLRVGPTSASLGGWFAMASC